MRRAGWGVWIAYDLPGSYEELPPNLLDELKRDRRWCHGNLMNFRLFLVKGMHSAPCGVPHRGDVVPVGAAVVPVPGAVDGVAGDQHPDGAAVLHRAVPALPAMATVHPEKAVALFSTTIVLLFLPKLLSIILIWAKAPSSLAGGSRSPCRC